MLYRKNLPVAERVLRSVGGLALVAYGLRGMKAMPLGYLLAITGVSLIVMGFVGYCPVCAVAGRRPVLERTDAPTTKPR